MIVHLPLELEQFLQANVSSGQFASEDEAIAEAVRLLKEKETGTSQGEAETPAAGVDEGLHLPFWKQTLEEMKSVPDEVFAAIPTDSSEQLDHYIYGIPRRPHS